MAERYPRQLSGGQQQRAALARALVVEPDLLLLDEPFSNLDAQLRVRLREEVVGLQRRIGTTTILVTHDQEEALAVSDRIAVLAEGRIAQLGTPETVYLRPATDFVAQFIGEVNVLAGRYAGGQDCQVTGVTWWPRRWSASNPRWVTRCGCTSGRKRCGSKPCGSRRALWPGCPAR